VPPAIVSKLNTEINAVLKTPELVQRWDALGIQPLGGSVADALRRNQMETEKWTAVITSANLKAE
jgi:tripartite-type tricarboxylate transporter receptor subunit TctC